MHSLHWAGHIAVHKYHPEILFYSLSKEYGMQEGLCPLSVIPKTAKQRGNW